MHYYCAYLHCITLNHVQLAFRAMLWHRNILQVNTSQLCAEGRDDIRYEVYLCMWCVSALLYVAPNRTSERCKTTPLSSRQICPLPMSLPCCSLRLNVIKYLISFPHTTNHCLALLPVSHILLWNNGPLFSHYILFLVTTRGGLNDNSPFILFSNT